MAGKNKRTNRKHWDKPGNFQGRHNPKDSSNTIAKNGSGPRGQVYKTEGGYKQAHVAGITNHGNGERASGKFGAASDVPSKLTFGRQSVTEQAGFKNQLQTMNVPENGTNGNWTTQWAYNPDVSATYKWAVPQRSAGVMAIHIRDYLGANNNTEKSPLNLAATLTKQFIDTSLGEQLSFSASDLGVYMGGIKSIWDTIYHVARCINMSHNVKDRANYRTAGLYFAAEITKENHPSPWVDPTYEIAANAPIYLERLNAIIKRLNTVPVPANFKWLVAYTESTYTQIYADADNDGAQLYLCKPQGVYVYDETVTHPDPEDEDIKYYNGAELVYQSVQSFASVNDGFITIPELLNMLEIMVEAACSKTNSDMMAQKIYNAYGTANVLQMPTFATTDDLVPIVYDEDFLEALENAKIIPDDSIIQAGYSIDANREMIIGRPVFTMKMGDAWMHNAPAACINTPLQFHVPGDQIDSHKVSNALRWHPYFSFFREDANDSARLELDFANNFGFQIVTKIKVVYLLTDGTLRNYIINGQTDISDYILAIRDFKKFPVGINLNYDLSNSNFWLNQISYSSDRDTEVTIAGEDVANYFWSLAEMVWDTVDGHSSFGGQRSKMG